MTCGGSLGKFPPSRSYGLFFVGRKHQTHHPHHLGNISQVDVDLRYVWCWFEHPLFLCTGEESPLLFFFCLFSCEHSVTLCACGEHVCPFFSFLSLWCDHCVTVYMWRTSVWLVGVTPLPLQLLRWSLAHSSACSTCNYSSSCAATCRNFPHLQSQEKCTGKNKMKRLTRQGRTLWKSLLAR